MLQLDKDETMWSMSMSNVSRRAYYSTGRGIAGLALRTGQRVNISTPKEHPHFDAQGDIYEDFAYLGTCQIALSVQSLGVC